MNVCIFLFVLLASSSETESEDLLSCATYDGVSTRKFPYRDSDGNDIYRCCPEECGIKCGAWNCQTGTGCCHVAAEGRTCGTGSDADAPPCIIPTSPWSHDPAAEATTQCGIYGGIPTLEWPQSADVYRCCPTECAGHCGTEDCEDITDDAGTQICCTPAAENQDPIEDRECGIEEPPCFVRATKDRLNCDTYNGIPTEWFPYRDDDDEWVFRCCPNSCGFHCGAGNCNAGEGGCCSDAAAGRTCGAPELADDGTETGNTIDAPCFINLPDTTATSSGNEFPTLGMSQLQSLNKALKKALREALN